MGAGNKHETHRWPRMDIMMFYEYIFETAKAAMDAVDTLNKILPEFHASTWHVFPLPAPTTVSISAQFIGFPDLLRFWGRVRESIARGRGYCALTLGYSTQVCGNAKINGTYMRHFQYLHRNLWSKKQTLRFYTGVPHIDLFFKHAIKYWEEMAGTGSSRIDDTDVLAGAIDRAIQGIGSQIILDGDKYVNVPRRRYRRHKISLTHSNMDALEEVISRVQSRTVAKTLELLCGSLRENGASLALPGANLAPPAYDKVQNITATELKESLIKENEKSIAHMDTVHALCNTLCGILLGPTFSALNWDYVGRCPVILCACGIALAAINLAVGLFSIGSFRLLKNKSDTPKCIRKLEKCILGFAKRRNSPFGDLRDYNNQLYCRSGQEIAEGINSMLPESERIKIQEADQAFGDRLLRTAKQRKMKSFFCKVTVAVQILAIALLAAAGIAYNVIWQNMS